MIEEESEGQPLFSSCNLRDFNNESPTDHASKKVRKISVFQPERITESDGNNDWNSIENRAIYLPCQLFES